MNARHLIFYGLSRIITTYQLSKGKRFIVQDLLALYSDPQGFTYSEVQEGLLCKASTHPLCALAV